MEIDDSTKIIRSAEQAAECLQKVTEILDSYSFNISEGKLIIAALLLPIMKAYDYNGEYGLRISTADMKTMIDLNVSFTTSEEDRTNEH